MLLHLSTWVKMDEVRALKNMFQCVVALSHNVVDSSYLLDSLGFPSAIKHSQASHPCMASTGLAREEAAGLLKLSIRHLWNNVTGSGLNVD